MSGMMISQLMAVTVLSVHVYMLSNLLPYLSLCMQSAKSTFDLIFITTMYAVETEGTSVKYVCKHISSFVMAGCMRVLSNDCTIDGSHTYIQCTFDTKCCCNASILFIPWTQKLSRT